VQTSTPQRPQYTGFLSSFLSASADAEELRAHYRRLARLKRPPKPATLEAVLSGYVCLAGRAEETVPRLQGCGQLLFAHQGTTYFQHRPEVTYEQAWAPLATTQREEVPA